MNFLFENIRLIDPIKNHDKNVFLWVKDGIIKHCSDNMPIVDNETEKIQSNHLVCSPGLFDMHVHFREPGFEYKEDITTGCNASANGGFTGVCCMPNTEPTIDSPAVVEFIKQKAIGNCTDLYISASITKNREGKHITPMYELAEYGVVLFTDDGNCVMSSETMRRAFEYSSTKDLLIAQHCEDHTLTKDFSINEGNISTILGLKGYPNVAEEIIIARDIMLAEFCGNCRYHIAHISTKNAIELVRQAKAKGLRVTCEVTPHHFSLTDDLLTDYSPSLKMNPPLRTKDDVEAIISGLIDGTIDCIATDHAPHSLHDKDVEFEKAPFGIIGLETSLGVALTYLYHNNRMTLKQIIEKMSTNPRKILKLPEINIAVGEKANLTIFSPDEEWVVDINTFKSKSRNSPYNGIRLRGKPVYTINNNQLYKCSL